MGTCSFSNSISISLYSILLVMFLMMGCTVTNSNQDMYKPTEHDITQAEADSQIIRYQQTYPGTAAGDIFTKASVETILTQPRISGIRYFYGLEANQLILILVGTQINTATNMDDDFHKGVILASPGSRNISITQAAEFTKSYRISNMNGVRGGFFSIDAVKAVLYDYNNPDTCTGMRFYYGLDNANTRQVIFRGTTGSVTSSVANDISDGRIIDMSIPCPNECGNKNLLNGM